MSRPALLVLLTIAGSSLAVLQPDGRLGSVPQEPYPGPTVFRELAVGAVFPSLSLVDLAGQATDLVPGGEEPHLIALIRPDQEGSRRLLADLEALVLGDDPPRARVTFIGMRGRSGPAWSELTKALPRDISFLLDDGTLSARLGLIVLPSVALLGSDGRLLRAYVLHDEELVADMAADMRLLEQGGPAALEESTQARRRFDEQSRYASAFEAAGRLQEALEARLHQLDLGLEPARVHLEIGRLHFLMGDAGSALRHFEQSDLLEETVVARTWIGRSMARIGKLDEAERVLLEVLPLTPQRAVTHRELAEVYRQRGDLDRALEHIKAAIESRHRTWTGSDDEPR